MKVTCPYCSADAKLTDSQCVYRRSYGMIWICFTCMAWVGVHKNSKANVPLGRLANAELRQWKQRAHAAFDPLWREGDMRRKQAYAWLAEQMGIPKNKCHIGMFDVPDCQRVVQIMKEQTA